MQFWVEVHGACVSGSQAVGARHNRCRSPPGATPSWMSELQSVPLTHALFCGPQNWRHVVWPLKVKHCEPTWQRSLEGEHDEPGVSVLEPEGTQTRRTPPSPVELTTHLF